MDLNSKDTFKINFPAEPDRLQNQTVLSRNTSKNRAGTPENELDTNKG